MIKFLINKPRMWIMAIIGLFCLTSNANCQNKPVMAAGLLQQKNFSFEENNGQLKDAGGNLLTAVKYFGHEKGVYVYCLNDQLSFVLTKVTHEPNQTGTIK